MLATRYTLTASPGSTPLANQLVGRAGAACLGMAVAFTFTRQHYLRAMTATILGIGAATS